ncbi:MAG: hypothetical protein KDB07_11550, partial [Planctomycetes bacterium]|nr:hypothetical protein [Planctomycetota bacterium]
MRASKHLVFSGILSASVLGLGLGPSSAQEGKSDVAEGESKVDKIFAAIEESAAKTKPIPLFSDKRDVFEEDAVSKAIAKALPDLDTSKYDISKVTDPGKDKREAYTTELKRVVEVWLAMDLAPTLNKVLELQKPRLNDDVALMVITAHFGLRYGIGLEQANRLLTRAISLAPEYGAAHYEASRYFLLRNQFEEALRSGNLAAKFSPTIADVYHIRAAIYQRLGDPQKAEEEYIKSLEMMPKDSTDVRYSLEQLYALNPTRTEELIKELLPKYQADTTVAYFHYIQGQIDINNRRYEDCISRGRDLIKSEAAKQTNDFDYVLRRDLLAYP